MRQTIVMGSCLLLTLPCLPELSGASRPITGKANARFAAVDEAMLNFMDRIGCQAATVAISRDGRLLYSRGYGWRDAAHHQPTLPTTLMRIASVSKPITAAEIHKLIRAHKLSMDTRVFALLHIRPYNGKLGDPRLNDITVRQLLDHRGGWDRTQSYDPMFRTAEIARALRLKGPVRPVHVVQYMLAQPLQFNPGTRSSYSNFGYCVLGRVIEHVTGRAYEEAVRQDILAPLGITDMKLGHNAPRARDPREVWYPPAADRFSVEVMDAHGGWVASAPALCRFLHAYWISGEPRQSLTGGEDTFFGEMPGTTSMARQRPDRTDVVFLLDKDTDAEPLRKALDEAIDRSLGAVRFAAIWEKGPGPAGVARHGLSKTELEKASTELGRQGLRPIVVSGYEDGGAARYAVLWVKAVARPWVARAGLTAAEYQQAVNRYTAAGYHLTFVDGYAVAGQAQFAAIWVNGPAPARLAFHGLGGDEYQKAFDQHGRAGYRLVAISAYTDGGQSRYASIWEKRGGPVWVARNRLTAAEYQRQVKQQAAAGYRLKFINGSSENGQPRFAAIWEKRSGPPMVARHNLTTAEYQREFDRLGAEGYRLVSLSAYNVTADR